MNGIDLTEKNELKALQKGAVCAFDSLYKKYADKLYFFVMKLSKNDNYMAEEIVQRVFIKIWESRTSVDVDKSFLNYLATIAKNMLMNEYKHLTVVYVYEKYILESTSSFDYTPEINIEQTSLRNYIIEQARFLPKERRKVFLLHFNKNYSTKEIGKLLNKSESTVEKQLQQSKKQIIDGIRNHIDKILMLLLLSI